jgi:uncharacterized protein VirK/YbjX
MINRALKQQTTELGPNMWQQQQGIAKYEQKFHIFIFHHHNNLKDGTAALSVYDGAAGWITNISFTFLTKMFRLYQPNSYLWC